MLTRSAAGRDCSRLLTICHLAGLWLVASSFLVSNRDKHFEMWWFIRSISSGLVDSLFLSSPFYIYLSDYDSGFLCTYGKPEDSYGYINRGQGMCLRVLSVRWNWMSLGSLRSSARSKEKRGGTTCRDSFPCLTCWWRGKLTRTALVCSWHSRSTHWTNPTAWNSSRLVQYTKHGRLFRTDHDLLLLLPLNLT